MASKMASAVAVEEEDEALDPSEQTNRPKDNALYQQRLQAWHPILHPVWVIVALFYLGVILVPVGVKLDSMQDDVVELKKTYDKYSANYSVDDQICGIGGEFNAGKRCTVKFTVPKDMQPPILVYYELENFHQNHRSYVQSRDDYQLAGSVGTQDKIAENSCQPLVRLGNQTLNPCGLIANTFFNDVFTLNPNSNNNITMREDGIAWESDLEYLFNQPDGFFSETCPNSTSDSEECDPTCCQGTTDQGDPWSCATRGPYRNLQDNQCYRYYYPNDDSTRYLYETYDNIISPLEGVNNEHFVVWMRVALQPTFRKLYGWIETPLQAGDELEFVITANYGVTRFRGAKSLILTTNSLFGGRNVYLGPIFIWVGVFCLAAGAFFTLKHWLRPRKLADRSYLHFKQD